MTTTTDQLSRLFSGISGNTFTLSAQQLGIDQVAQLFNAYLPGGTLTIQNPLVDHGTLTVSGQTTPGNAQNMQTSAQFLTAGKQVTGIVITMALTSWDFKAPFVTFPGKFLRDFGCQDPQLILRAGGNDPATSDPQATLSASLKIQTPAGARTATLVAQIPTPDEPYDTNFVFQAELTDVTFADLSALKQFVQHANFALLPSGIPVASALELQLLKLVIDPSDDEIVSLQCDVRSVSGLEIVKGVFEISEVLFSFDVLFPTTSASVYASIQARFTIYGQVIDTWLSLPDMFFEGDIDFDQPIPLNHFAAHFLPTDGLPDFSISDMRFVLDLLKPNDYLFEIGLIDLWHLSLGNKQIEFKELHVSMAGTGAKTPALTIKGEVAFAGTTLYLGAQRAGGRSDWTFEGGTVVSSQIDIGSMMAELIQLSGAAPATLPPEIPSLTLSSINIATAPNGVFDVTARGITTWDLPFGVSGLSVSTLDFALHRSLATGGHEQVTCSINLHSDGPVTIVEGLIFKSLDFSFDLDQQTKNWLLSGTVFATILGVDATFAASLSETPALRTIALQASAISTAPLIDLGAVGSLTATDLTILISKALQPATSAGGISLQPSSSYTWSVQATGALTLSDVFTLNGMLALTEMPQGASLVFKPALAQVAISLPDPLQSWTTHLALEELSFASSTDSQGKKTWSLEATTNTWFSGLPSRLQAIVPSSTGKVVGSFKADSSSVQLVIDRVVQPVAFAIPSNSLTGDLGEAMIDLSHLAFILGRNMSLALDIGFGIPEKLNTIFGTKGDGSPLLSLFNTYVPENDTSVTKLAMRLDRSNGLQLVPLTSPLKAITFENDGTNSWCNADLGEFGAFRFMVPVFSYSAGQFSGSGSFTLLRPLKVPLSPMKWLLTACGLDAVGKMIPDGLLVEGRKIYDSSAGTFNSNALIDFVEGLHMPLSDEVKVAIQAMAHQLDKLPDRFKSYLDVDIPKQFSFDMAISSSSIRGGMQVDKSTPIKLLYPTLGLLGPQLNGIELYGFSVGEMLDGALLLLNLDMIMDQFHLLTLIAALALPLDKLPILPRTQDLETMVTIHNLFMLIIYETGLPIPVPLFYDELALDYLGLEGLALQTHWSFPKPSLSPVDAGHIFADFKQFFTDHNHLLDANVAPQKMDLVLTIGPNYLQLPQYLGGAGLGSKENKIVISSYESLAHLLNALKTLSLNELIQALPLDDRVGKETVSFACMTLEVDWLVTTPQEFRSISYKRLNIVEGDSSTLLQVVPPTPAKDDQGLVIFLRGAWQLSTVAALDATFGLIGTDGGFGTGMHVSGKISDLLAVDLAGVVVIDPKASAPFSLDGHSSLVVAGRTIFTGTVQIDRQHFFMSGQLSLFPPSSPLQISGSSQAQIDRQGQFLLHTAINVALQNFVLDGSVITITNTSLEISGTWLGRTVTFLIIVKGNDFTFTGSCSLGLGINVSVGPIYEKLTGLKIVDQLALNTSLNVTLEVTLGTLGFAADVTATFTWNSFQLAVPVFHIAVAPKDIAALTDLLVQQIQAHVSDIFALVFNNMTAWLKAGVDGLVQVTSQWQPAVEAARKWSAAGWNATEQWSTHAWQSASQWSAAGWNATTTWSDDAWNATTTWSDDTWNASKTWSTATWNATSGWTKDQFMNAAKTAADLMRSLHTDTSTPHVDTASRHADTPATAHADVAAQHADTPAKAHVDAAAQHGDTVITPHGDTHADVMGFGTHADVPRSHVDTTVTPHVDTQAIPHVDTTITPHVDTQAIPHIDQSTPHADIAGQHVDVTP